MARLQQANVAGLFYPDDPQKLRQDISHYLAQAQTAKLPAPKALVAPHAGYVYSGPIAGSAYASLLNHADRYRRVLVLAPSHFVAFRGLALPDADRFNTPLGDIAIDTDAAATLRQLPQVQVMPEAFAQEHALEVQLPFLQQTLKDFTLLPLVVGDASSAEVAEVIAPFWDDEHTLIVVSSDLSHYQDYASACQHDRHTSDAIEALDENLAYGDACGRNPLRGLLRVARQHGLSVTTVDLRNSGDTAGDRARVVGYGAYVFH